MEFTDEKGDRRNCVKIKLSKGDFFKLSFMIIPIIVGLIIGWTTLKINVKALADDTEKNETKIEEVEEENNEQDKIIVTMQNDVQYIKEDVKEIKQGQDEQKVLLYTIIGKLEE